MHFYITVLRYSAEQLRQSVCPVNDGQLSGRDDAGVLCIASQRYLLHRIHLH